MQRTVSLSLLAFILLSFASSEGYGPGADALVLLWNKLWGKFAGGNRIGFVKSSFILQSTCKVACILNWYFKGNDVYIIILYMLVTHHSLSNVVRHFLLNKVLPITPFRKRSCKFTVALHSLSLVGHKEVFSLALWLNSRKLLSNFLNDKVGELYDLSLWGGGFP